MLSQEKLFRIHFVRCVKMRKQWTSTLQKIWYLIRWPFFVVLAQSSLGNPSAAECMFGVHTLKLIIILPAIDSNLFCIYFICHNAIRQKYVGELGKNVPFNPIKYSINLNDIDINDANQMIKWSSESITKICSTLGDSRLFINCICLPNLSNFRSRSVLPTGSFCTDSSGTKIQMDWVHTVENPPEETLNWFLYLERHRWCWIQTYFPKFTDSHLDLLSVTMILLTFSFPQHSAVISVIISAPLSDTPRFAPVVAAEGRRCLKFHAVMLYGL